MADLHLGLHFHFSPWAAPYLAAGALADLGAWLVVTRGGPHRMPFLRLVLAVGATLTVGGLAGSSADATTALLMLRLAQTAAAWVAPAAISFAGGITGRRLGSVLVMSLLLALATSALMMSSPWMIAGVRPTPYGFAAVAGPLYIVALTAMGLAMATPLVFWQALAAERRALERRQLPVLLGATLLGGLGLVDVLPAFGWDTPPVGWVPLLMATGMLLFALARYRFTDVQLLLRRGGTWLLLTLAGAAPFVLAGALGRRLADHPLALGLWLSALVLAMRAYLVSIHPRLERLIGRRRFDLDAEVGLLTEQLGTLQTTEELGRAIDGFLATVDRRLAALVVIDPSGRPRVALSAWGSVPPPSRGSPLLVDAMTTRGLRSRDQARGPARVEIERACVRWGAEYLGPLVEGETLHGLIAISPKLGGGRADAIELEALDRMCVTVTAALTGARLYERLRGLARELEQKAEARRQSLAQALAHLRGAEALLVANEKFASLGQIVSGVAAELSEQVKGAFVEVARLREHAEILTVAAEEARGVRPELADPAFEEASHDILPLLDAVSEGARRANGIVSDLTRFAPDPGAAPASERRPTALAALLDSTLKLVTSQLRGVELVREYDAALAPVVVEPGPLGQVILNLLLNAAEAMRGSGTLTVTARRAGEWAELSVGDTGPGIPPEVLPRIFEPFFTTKGPTSGTGLGLSISYGIVARHGGRIRVDSALGKGTRFIVELPLGTQPS